MTRDLRKYAQQTNVRLGISIVLFFFVVGTGLIWWVYGFGAAMMGLLCLVGALIPAGLIFLSLKGLDWINERAHRD